MTTKPQSSPKPSEAEAEADKVTDEPVKEKVKHDAENHEKEKNEKITTVSKKEKNKLPWSRCYQPASALASCENDDILLLLCNRYLYLEDVISLSLTCRRLYSIYRQALGCVQHLQLTHLQVFVEDQPNIQSYECRLWDFTNSKEEEQQFRLAPGSLLKNIQIDVNGTMLIEGPQFMVGPSALLTSGLLSSAQLPGLTVLELNTAHLGTSFFLGHLFGSLNTLQRLEILKLKVRSVHWLVDLEGETASVKNPKAAKGPAYKISQMKHSRLLEPPCAQLRLPALKHLTLAVKGIRLCEKGQRVAKRRSSSAGKLVGCLRKNIAGRSPLADCHFAIDCPQLISLKLYSADTLVDICEIIRRTVLPNTQLTNAVTESTGGQVAIIQQLLRDNVLPPEPLDTEALAHITHLWVEANFADESLLLRLLPTLQGLQQIKLFIRSCEEVARYPEVLAALATLPRLHSLLLDCRDSRHGDRFLALPPRLPRPPPQLTGVTSLSVLYSTVFHDQLLKKYLIVECFPNLTTFRVTIVFNCCRPCRYMIGPFDRTDFTVKRYGGIKFPILPLFDFFKNGFTEVSPYREKEMRRFLMPCARALTAELSTLSVDPGQLEVRFMSPELKIIKYLSYNTVTKQVERVKLPETAHIDANFNWLL